MPSPNHDRKAPPPPDWPERFLRAYGKNGNISQSARTAKVTRRSVQLRRKENSDFAEAMAEAQEEATDALETEARRRAVTGTLRPVFYQGAEVGRVREYSDTLLIVLLKGNRPAKYRDVTQTNRNVDLAQFTDAELLKLAEGIPLEHVLADASRRRAGVEVGDTPGQE